MFLPLSVPILPPLTPLIPPLSRIIFPTILTTKMERFLAFRRQDRSKYVAKIGVAIFSLRAPTMTQTQKIQVAWAAPSSS